MMMLGRQTSHCAPNWRQQASRHTGLAAFQMRFPSASHSPIAVSCTSHSSTCILGDEGKKTQKKTKKHFRPACCLTWCGEAVLGFLLGLRRLLLALGLISAAAGGRRRAVRREGGVDTLGGRVAPLQQQAHALRQERQIYLYDMMKSANILKVF